MKLSELYDFIAPHDHVVQASNGPDGQPQAAVVGVVCTPALELVFDTLGDTRKAQNLRRDPRVSVVIGWDTDAAQTVQYEGVADEPTGEELVRLRDLYLARFPDGRERMTWPGITWFRVRPTWLRYSDFRGDAPVIVEWDAAALDAGRTSEHSE